MIRNGRRTNSFLQRYLSASKFWLRSNSRDVYIIRRHFADDCCKGPKGGKGKSSKGVTAKVEECLPVGCQKKLPTSSFKPCPPPPKIKIPSCPPVKPPCKPPCPKSDICDFQPKYDACRPGGLRNPVVQVCKKPNMMDDCCKPPPPICPEDPNESKKKFVRNLILSVIFFSVMTFAMFKLLQKEEEVIIVKKEIPKRVKKRRHVCKEPPTSGEIPDEVPYLLIGGGTATFAAFRAIRARDRKAKILIITNEGEFPYMRPPLSKEIWYHDEVDTMEDLEFKQWNGNVRSIYYEPEDFYLECKDLDDSEKGGVAVAKGWRITKIDPQKNHAYLDDGAVITYNKCLIATGSKPKSLGIVKRLPQEVKDRIQIYRDIWDFKELREALNEPDCESIAIIGGGFLGSELACALTRYAKLREKELTVYQIFQENANMGKILPEYLSMWTTKKIEKEGVTVMPNTQVIDAFIAGDKLNLMLNNGERLIVDHCVTALGAKPNTDLAEVSELEVDDEQGGYLVNAELQARSNLYVAGDAACFYDVKLGRRRMEHHDNAIISGRIAGENMTGRAKPYVHQSMFWSDLGPEVGYEAIGIVDARLPTVAVFAKKTKKDTPGHVVAKTNKNIRSQTEAEAAPIPPAKGSPKPPKKGEDYGKGIIFYLRDDIVVGIVMWNVFNRMKIARQVLQDERKYENLNEVAKLFNIHEE